MSLFGKTSDANRIGGNARAQFGLAVSLGLMIGLLPKDSLLPWAVGLIALIAPINLGAGLVALAVGACLSLTLDSTAHFVGQIGLRQPDRPQLDDPIKRLAWLRLGSIEQHRCNGSDHDQHFGIDPRLLDTAHAAYRDRRFLDASEYRRATRGSFQRLLCRSPPNLAGKLTTHEMVDLPDSATCDHHINRTRHLAEPRLSDAPRADC